jgi:hypothetical protein
MKTIRIHDKGTGKHRDYAVRHIDELTIAEWYDITVPPVSGTIDETIELIHRWVKIPKGDLVRLSVGEMDRLAEGLGMLLGGAAKARTEAFTPGKTFSYSGITYTVPQNIEADTTFAQWADLNAAIEGIEHDADLIPIVVSYLLVEEGKEYDGSVARARVAQIRDWPVEYPLKLTAFFLDSGTRLQSVMSRYMSARLTYAVQLLQPVLNGLSSVTDGSLPSTALPAPSLS